MLHMTLLIDMTQGYCCHTENASQWVGGWGREGASTRMHVSQMKTQAVLLHQWDLLQYQDNI